ncbi:MAG: hypothetical protein EHM63_04210, partial [Actinobacteria bacterium]
MRKTTRAAWLAAPLAGFLLLAACGDDSDSSSATTGGGAATTGGAGTTASGGAATTGAGGEAASLAGACPETVIVQTDWNPEAEHGALYELLGDDFEVDTSTKAVTGSLV